MRSGRFFDRDRETKIRLQNLIVVQKREPEMFGRRKITQLRGKEYATRADFEQVFSESMSGLHLLAYLLTADKDKAEQCFVSGLEDSVNGNPVFRDWARSWSRRAIIKRAILMIHPAAAAPDLSREAPQPIQVSNTDFLKLADSVTSLAAFPRFVFVMAVLEGYSSLECALLLNSTRHSVRDASAEAIRHVTSRCPGVPNLAGAIPKAWRAFFAAA